MSSKKTDRSNKKTQRGSVDSSMVTLPQVDYLLNDKQLLKTVLKEDDDLVVYAVREELLDRVMDIVQERYLEKQCVKFNAHCAHRALVMLLNYHYLLHDPGRPFYKDHPDWKPDLQPEPSPPDSWSGQKVPVRAEVVLKPVEKAAIGVFAPEEPEEGPPCPTEAASEEGGSFLNVLYETCNTLGDYADNSTNLSSFVELPFRSLTGECGTEGEHGQKKEGLGGGGEPLDEKSASEVMPEGEMENEIEEETEDDEEETLSTMAKSMESRTTETTSVAVRSSKTSRKAGSIVTLKLPKIVLDPLPQLPDSFMSLHLDSFPPLRAEAKYKPVPEVIPEPKLKCVSRECKMPKEK